MSLFFRYNHYLVIAKYQVRNQSETSSLQVFVALLESKIKCERQMAIKTLIIKHAELSGQLSVSAMREYLIFMFSNNIKPTMCLQIYNNES